MDTSGISTDTMRGAMMVKKALEMQAQNAAQLINSVPQPQQAAPQQGGGNPPNLGQRIDVTA